MLPAAAEPYPAGPDASSHVQTVLALLRRLHRVSVVDCGSGVTHPVTRSVLDMADTVVVAAGPTPDELSRAIRTLDWVADSTDHGSGLAATAVVVLSSGRSTLPAGRVAAARHFQNRAQPLLELPRDPHLATGRLVRPAGLRPATRAAALELAATVADRFRPVPATPHRGVTAPGSAR